MGDRACTNETVELSTEPEKAAVTVKVGLSSDCQDRGAPCRAVSLHAQRRTQPCRPSFAGPLRLRPDRRTLRWLRAGRRPQSSRRGIARRTWSRSEQGVSQAITRRVGQGSRCHCHDGLWRCLPVYPGKRYVDWELDDPTGQPVEAVRSVMDEIDRRVRMLTEEPLAGSHA